MKTRLLIGLSVLVVLAAAVPAVARPCCSDCDSWPNLDYLNDACARVCEHSCFAAASAETASVNSGGCGQQIQLTPATPVSALFASTQAARTGQPGLECVWFCSIALCPEGTNCGPTPSGGCGCNPGIGGTV